MPAHLLPVHCEIDVKILRCKFALIRSARRVAEGEVAGLNQNRLEVRQLMRELRYWQLAIEEDQRGAVLKFPIRCPLHANQLWSKHCESRFSDGENRFR